MNHEVKSPITMLKNVGLKAGKKKQGYIHMHKYIKNEETDYVQSTIYKEEQL